MEDRQGLDVLKRARKLNPDVKLILVSDDLNVGFPLETYRIEVDDYLLLPITPRELRRRVGKCLGKVLDLKATETPAVRAATRMNEQSLSLIMMMFHDIRGSLVSTAASLKILKRGKYEDLSSQTAERLQELSAGIKNSTDLIDKFAHEILAGHGQGAASDRRRDGQHDLLKSVPKNLIPELRQSAETLAEPN
jgi:DNA-binding NarL/FixJ family response regulator